MKKSILLFIAAVLSVGASWAQNSAGAQATSNASATASQNASASAGQAQTANPLPVGMTVEADLSKALDVKKCKPGDEVLAKITQDVKADGRTVLAKGSKVVGRITQAQVREKGQEESQLGIAFDHAVMKDGTPIPASFTIRAIARSEASAALEAENASMAGGAAAPGSPQPQGGGAVAGAGRAAGGVVNTAGSGAGGTLSAPGGVGGNVAGGLTASSQGAVGLPGLTLSSSTSSNASVGSVISSKSSNVRLDSGTRMILRVN